MVGVGYNIRLESYIQVNLGVQIGAAVSVEEEILIGSGSIVLSPVRERITVIRNPAKRVKLHSFNA
jgi:serine acetyltransferase